MDCSKKGLTKTAASGGSHSCREQKATSELSRPSRRSAPSAWRRTRGWLLPVLAATIIFAPPFALTAEAQTTLVGNVDQTRSGSLGFDTHEGAQAFTTGDNSDGYTVTSVGLDMSLGADHTINFTVGIWNSNSNLPGSSLGTLTQPASLISGVNEFTTSGITLAANTTYWVVVDSTGGGSAQWEGTASDSEGPTSLGWSIADESYDRPYNGDTWSPYTDPFKLRVTGTAIGSAMNNAPVFTEGTSTTRSVAENTASGQNIGAAVMATDTDTSDTLTYTLGGTDAADFGIVPSSGQLQTSAALNFETKASYAVTVSVSDGNGGTDSIDVTINVTADRAALVALYNATGGADWTNNTNWLTDKALSEWYGVETDEDGRVRELNLNANKLSREIPVALGRLTNLKLLHLNSNELSGKIPAELGDLTNLQLLLLNDNELMTGTIPTALANLAQLQEFDFSNTGLCAPSDAAFQAWLATIIFQGAVCAPPPPPPPSPGGGGGRPPGGGGPRQTVPDAPRNLLADATDGAVMLMWEAPEDDGGAVITDYEYRIDQRGDWISIGSTATTHTIAGLVNGTTYVFQVRAVNRIGRSQPSDPVEATPIAQVFLDLAHFANGAGIISEVVLVNVAPHPIRPALYFYDQEGEPIAAESMVDVLGDLGIQEDGGLTIRTEMEPLGELTISTHGRGELVSGSVRVVSDGPIGGVLRFDLPGIGVAGVGASHPVSDAIFPARRQADGISTAAAIHNLGEEALVVGCQLMKDGAVLEEEKISLEANGQEARYIEEMFTSTDTSDFVGSVRCTARLSNCFSVI